MQNLLRTSATSRGTRRPPLGVAVVLVAAGLLFTASAGAARGTDLRSETSDLPSLIREETARVDATARTVTDLRAQVQQLSEDVGDPQVDVLADAAGDLAAPAGLQGVSGPGVRVVLDDAPRDLPAPEWATPDDLVVHQQDVQAVVNALWAGGAEAMSLMDQRVVSTSAVRCVGSTLRLQGRVYSPPYTITAVGDPYRLLDALERDTDLATYRSWSEVVGLGWDVSQHQDVDLPAFEGSLELQHARAPRAALLGREPGL